MKRLLKTMTIALIPLLTVAACKHQVHEEEVSLANTTG